MTSLLSTIQQYQQSCKHLEQRIAELNSKICGREPLLESESLPLLCKRRYLLYTELTEMKGDIHQMEEYLTLTGPVSSTGGH